MVIFTFTLRDHISETPGIKKGFTQLVSPGLEGAAQVW